MNSNYKEIHIRLIAKEKQQIHESAKLQNISIENFILNSAYQNTISTIEINNIDSINNQLDKEGELINSIAKGLNSLLKQERLNIDLLSYLVHSFEEFNTNTFLNQSSSIIRNSKNSIIIR